MLLRFNRYLKLFIFCCFSLLPFKGIIAQNNIDFSRPEEAWLIEDSIVNWMFKLFPGTQNASIKRQDADTSKSKLYSSCYVSHAPKNFNPCPPEGPDCDIFINCDTIYYFTENNQKYAFLLFRHSECGRNKSGGPGFYGTNSSTFQSLSILILKYAQGVWMTDYFREVPDYLNISSRWGTGTALLFDNSLPKIHFFGRDMIIVERYYSKSGDMGVPFLCPYTKDSTYLYHINFSNPVFKFYSYHEESFSPYEKYNSAFSKIDLHFEFINEEPILIFKFFDKSEENEKIEELPEGLRWDGLHTNFYSGYEIQKLAMLNFSKSKVRLYDLIAKITEKPTQYKLIPPSYFNKKYSELTDQEAYDLIAGKSLSYYYKSDSFNYTLNSFSIAQGVNHTFFHDNCNCGSCLLPYVDHLFLRNGEYYKISNEYRNLEDFSDLKIPEDFGFQYRCVDLLPNIVKKGTWKISDKKLILNVIEESYVEQQFNYNLFSKTDSFTVKISGRSGWPYNDTLNISVFSNIESLLYEIAETECRFGYRIGDPLFEKQSATKGEIKLTSMPFGLDNKFLKCGNKYLFIKDQTDEKLNNERSIEKKSEFINTLYKKLE
jgi:hypothetical protein